jgi:predicted nucleic acid-binding protein
VLPTHLADTSALLELHQTAVASRLVGLLVGGRIATCGVVDLDLLALVAGDERPAVLEERRQFPRVPCDDDVADRALAVQALVGDPSPTTAQLLVAAAAERAGLVLLHQDEAFERIAAVTGQPTERAVAP